MNKEKQRPYPVLTKQQIVDLFRLILFWKCFEKTEETNPKHMYLTFDTFQDVMRTLEIVHPSRFEALVKNPEFIKAFLAKALIVNAVDDVHSDDIFHGERRFSLAIRMQSDETVNGNRINMKDLFSLRKVYITHKGMVVGPVVERLMSPILKKSRFLKLMKRWKEARVPHVAFASYKTGYSQWVKDTEQPAGTWAFNRRRLAIEQ